MRTQLLARSSFLAAAVFALLLLGLPSLAAAQGDAGVRAGVSADPDQFYLGAHFDTGYVVEHLSFRPNLEVGLGDDTTTVAANFEFVYWFPSSRHPIDIYAGAGPAMNLYRRDRGHDGSDTDVEPGLNLLVGVAHTRGLFAEFKVGLIDSPELKFAIGYAWR